MLRLRNILLLLLVLFPLEGMAQEENYTERLKQRSANGGVVVVFQDAEIEELVNGSEKPQVVVRDTLGRGKTPERTSGPHTKANGYRVQIFMAGNTANDKALAKSNAKRFKTYYPAVNAYVRFSSPHWVCEVGDFRTQAEANEFLKRVRAQFRTSYVVRSKVNEFK